MLLIDLDTHCGGGTVSLSLLDGLEVVHIDVAVSVAGDRLLLQRVRSADEYLPRIERQLRRWGDVHFDVALYNAGMDPHQASMVGLHGMVLIRP